MSGRYLTDLDFVLDAAGLSVITWSGWQTRARSSGGYADGRPWCVMWHHTASMSDPEQDAAYIADGDPDAPLANLLIDRAGVVWLIAAGATNTNGKGYALSFSRGTVPDDQMNTYAVGIEIANNGIGEPYPAAQIDAAFTASLAICAAEGLDPADVAGHDDWAPDRKIDPATANAVQGAWQPKPVNSSGSWSLVDLRDECWRRAGATPVPPKPPIPQPGPPEEDQMKLLAYTDDNATVWIGDGLIRRPVPDLAQLNNLVALRLIVYADGTPIVDPGAIPYGGPDLIEALGPPP